MPTRDAVLEAIDAEDLYGHFGVALVQAGDQFKAVCPFHDDRNPSMSVSKEGLFNCFSCDARGSPFDFVVSMARRAAGAAYGEMLEPSPTRQETAEAFKFLIQRYSIEDAPRPVVKRDPRKKPPVEPVDEAVIKEWQDDLQRHPDVLAYLTDERGLDSGTILGYRLGWDERSGRITMPVYGGRVCVNVRKYLPPPRPDDVPKIVSYAKGYGEHRPRR